MECSAKKTIIPHILTLILDRKVESSRHQISVDMWYVATDKYSRHQMEYESTVTTVLQGSRLMGFGLNFQDAVEMTQNPVNFAAGLSIICSNQSIFVKYARRRLYRTASKMCA